VNDSALVLPLDDIAADLATAGGKGASLARLAGAGLPVPPGFHVTTRAYRDFVSADGLAEEIRTALRAADPADPIAAAFARRQVPEAVAEAVAHAYRALSDGPVAVRSSGTAEDLPGMSFAGQHDTFLNITGTDALLDAVKRCWASLWTARAIDYRTRGGIAHDEVALAVVVQRLVPADAAGVLFTANPLTGARGELVVNAAWGLGEAVVGGQVTPDTYVLAHGTRESVRREVNDKAVMTVRTAGGTGEEPVPDHLRREPVLDEAAAAELAGLGERVQDLYGAPVDVEWAVHDGRFAILQARPITNLTAEVWNDSLRGDYLWTCANLGEAVTTVMSPITWSVAQVLALPTIAGHPVHGNICGRFYFNLSVPMAVGSALGFGKRIRRTLGLAFGRIPSDVEIPGLPMSRPALLRATIRMAWPILRQEQHYRKGLAAAIAQCPNMCEALHRSIRETDDPRQLAALWRSDVDPLLRETCRTLDAGARQPKGEKVQRDLVRLVGEGDTNTLMTGLQTDTEDLLSLGPLLGLVKLRRGEIDQAAYARNWGHRGAEEFEISAPRPAEDPEWIDRQLRNLSGQEPEALLERQAKARDEAWQRLRLRYPRKAAKIRRQLDRAAEAARARERARSEFVRPFWVFRAFVLRAGELTGIGDDLFYLPYQEVLAVLDGDQAPLASVAANRAADERFRSLPPYPTLIRGRFDAVTWAADPDRRSDLYDETADHAPMGEEITGFGGAVGVVDGVARVITTLDEGEALQPGEILVTTVTNIGWTPLFPRAAAVVTDIGAPLSHAAIVARELGIPAVVGCGNATTRIKTGDRVRVDGANGTVTHLPWETVPS
jgi:rifampicin phosphotransferase